MPASIVSGNGFAGHAQRSDNELILINNSYELVSDLYDLSFQYRSSHAVTVFGESLSAVTGNAQTVTINSLSAPGQMFQMSLDDVVSWEETSSTTMSVPTSHPTSKTFTVATGKSYISGLTISVYAVDTAIYGTVVSYNSGTGELVLNSTSNYGTGTFSNWNIYFGELGYSTSTTTNSIPQTHPTQVTFMIDPGETLTPGTVVTCSPGIVYFEGTITSYNSGTGSLTMNSSSNVGTGTTSSWNIIITQDYWFEVGTIDLFFA